jgi:transposase-like protein
MKCPACGSANISEDDTNPGGFECDDCGEQFWEEEAVST